jgi:hypothetical protein
MKTFDVKETIQFVGVDELEHESKELINKLANEYYDKIKRSLSDITSMKVHVKVYDEAGKEEKARKWGVHVQVLAPTQMFETSAQDWDIERTLHKAFKAMEKEIQHRLHTDDQRFKVRRPNN